METVIPILRFPLHMRLSIIRKMTPVMIMNMRFTCSPVHEFLEEQRNRIFFVSLADELNAAILLLAHASSCHSYRCRRMSCDKMKSIVRHVKMCKKRNSKCDICPQACQLSFYHAKQCKDDQCSVPYCLSIRQQFAMEEQSVSVTDAMQALSLGANTSLLNGSDVRLLKALFRK